MKYKSAEEYLRDWPEGVSGGKGEGTSKKIMQQQFDLQKQAFDAQQAQLAKVNAAANPYLSGTVGYDPALLSMLQSQFQNQTAGDYGQAAQAVRQALLARGSSGQTPMSGTDVRGLLGLESAKANTLSQGTLGIGIQNLQQALTNRFNAMSVMGGNAATLNSPISTFGSGGSNALNQYVQASNSGFGASLMRGLGSGLGAGLGGGISGGIGNALANTWGIFSPQGTGGH